MSDEMDGPFGYVDIRAEQAQELVDTLRVRLGGQLFNEQQLPLATLEVLAAILEVLHVIEGHLRPDDA